MDETIAPGISEFTTAELPDLTEDFPQAKYWLANHFLSTILRGRFKDDVRQVVVGYLRRAYYSFNAYHDARRITLEYLESNDPHNPSVTKYYAATGAWETLAVQVSMALDLFKWMNGGEGAFKKNDNSKEQRLYTIANEVKHTSSCVASGQCSASDTVPLWLTNDGLHSFTTSISYQEALKVLRDIAALADGLQDPKTFLERNKKRPAKNLLLKENAEKVSLVNRINSFA